MPTSSFDPSAADIITYNWPKSGINHGYLVENRPQRLELEDFEDDSFHPESYVFERIHFMEEEEEVSRIIIPIQNISAKMWTVILKFDDIFYFVCMRTAISLAMCTTLIGGSSQLPCPTMWSYYTCIHFRSRKQWRLRINDDSCKSNHFFQLWNWFKWIPLTCSQISKRRRCQTCSRTISIHIGII